MPDFCKTETFAKRFQEAMYFNGYKKADIAVKLGKDRSIITKYCNGVVPRDDVIEQLARILNVNEMWLLGYDVEKDRIEWDAESQEIIDTGSDFSILLPEEKELLLEVIRDDRKKRLLFQYLRLLAYMNAAEEK